jgi:hypothetical protein
VIVPRSSKQAKTDLLEIALRHLAGVGLHVVELSRDDGEAGVDALLRAATPSGSIQLYEIQVKPTVSPSTALAIRAARHGRPLVVTSYVSDSVADYWRDQDIHYVDSVGNMYLRLDGLAADVRGRKAPAQPRPAEPGRSLRAFKSSGLRILFSLLADPSSVESSYRELAMALGLSLGTVQWIFKELEELGYIELSDRQLHRTGQLLDRWVEAYALDLAPKLTIARFDAPDPMWWTDADKDLRAEGAQWGGETAAHFLNLRLRPGRAIVYASAMPTRLVGKYRLRKANDLGNMEVRQRFWERKEEPPALIVPTPLVYADLVASADPRQLEAAAQLRERDDLLRRLDRG